MAAATKTINGLQILTGSANDSITLGAPTLGIFIDNPGLVAATLIKNLVVNTNYGPVGETWSNSAPFDPNATQFSLSFSGSKGSVLSVSQNIFSRTNPQSYENTISLTSGDNSIALTGDFKNSFPQFADSNGNFINSTTNLSGSFLYTDSKGTASTADDIRAYFTISGTGTYDSASKVLKYHTEGTTGYNYGNYNLYASSVADNTSTVSGNANTNPVITFHTGESVFKSYAYWTGTGFAVQFSGTSSINADNNTNTFKLQNVVWTDYASGYQIKASQANIAIQNPSPTNPNLGAYANDDIAGVQASLTTNFLPSILNSGVTVTALNAAGASLKGGLLADTILGGAGGDTITGGGSNDKIDGGAGINTAVYSGKFADYTVTTDGNGTYTVTDSVNNRDGIDTLTNIQFLAFSDTNKAIADIAIKAGPNLPTLAAPAILNLVANSTTSVQNWFAAQPAKGGAPVDLYVFYEAGSGPNTGHLHVNNGYILQNNVWSAFSGDVPQQTVVAVGAGDFSQVTYSAPKIVGLHDDLYAGVAANGQWSSITHTVINT